MTNILVKTCKSVSDSDYKKTFKKNLKIALRIICLISVFAVVLCSATACGSDEESTDGEDTTLGDYFVAIVGIPLGIILWVLYHSIFTVAYFDNGCVSVLIELVICYILGAVIAKFLAGMIVPVLIIGGIIAAIVFIVKLFM